MTAAHAVPPEEIARLKRDMPLAFRAPLSVRIRNGLLLAAALAFVVWCVVDFDITFTRISAGLGRLGGVLSFMFPPVLWSDWQDWEDVLAALAETLAMAFMGTTIGAVIALPLSFLGARTINRLALPRFGLRRGFDILRAVETLILALVFIRAFGLGPMAGVLAIAVGEVGTLAKLYSEAIENLSDKPVEGVIASGGSRGQSIRYGLMPQVIPVLVSITLYNFESNARTGTILGIVGAGGIGFLLSDRIGAYRWGEAWTIIILIIAMVYVIDHLSGRIRGAVIGIRPSGG